MRLMFFVLATVFVFRLEAASYTPSDVEFISKSNDRISYVLSVEAREAKIAETSDSLVRDLGSFYDDLIAAGAKGSSFSFLERRKKALAVISESLKSENPLGAVEAKLNESSKNSFKIFQEKSPEQSLAVIIHLYALNQELVMKKNSVDLAFLAGKSAFHSSLLGQKYLKRFLDLSDSKDKRRASAKEMLDLVTAVKNK